MTVPPQYPSGMILRHPSVPKWHAIITIGMADLGELASSFGQAGERRMRRKRSPRRIGIPDLPWTRAKGAGLEAPSRNAISQKLSKQRDQTDFPYISLQEFKPAN